MKIGVKITLLVACLVIISLLITASFAYSSAAEVINQRVEGQLESIIILTTEHFKDFITERKKDMNALSSDYNTFVQSQKNNENMTNDSREYFNDSLYENPLFFEFFVMNADGIVIVSTDKSQERKIKSDEPYFINGLKDIFVQSFYLDRSLNRPSITITLPVGEVRGNTAEVIAGRVNIEQISNFITRQSRFGETGETVLVNSFNVVVTQLLKEDVPLFSKTIYTDAVVDCLKNKPINVRILSDYKDYHGDSVIGAYRFIPELNVCIISEMDQSEAFASLIEYRNNLIFVTLCAIISTILLGYVFSKTITKPIKTLSALTQQIRNGNLDAPTIIASKDEIGELSKEFDIMRKSLKKSKNELLETLKNLDKNVDNRTMELNEKIKQLRDNEAATLNIMEDLQRTHEVLQVVNSELERKVDDRTAEISSLLKQKDEFINQLGHDLKNPLTPLTTLLPVLKKQVSDTKSLEYFDVVLRNVQYMKNLVVKTLELARLNSPSTILSIEDINLTEKINDTLLTQQLMFQIKHIIVDNKIKDTIIIQADNLRFEELLKNLLNNAVNYTPDGGSITLDAQLEKENVTVSIQDTGVGLTKEQTTHIFDEFYKVDQSRHDFDSSGLGLPICKRIVEKHGGKIWVESEGLGKGCIFYFTIKTGKKGSMDN